MSKRSPLSGNSPINKSQKLTKAPTLPLESSRGSGQDEEDPSFGFVDDSSGEAKGKPPDIFKERSTESSEDSSQNTSLQFERTAESSESEPRFCTLPDSQKSSNFPRTYSPSSSSSSSTRICLENSTPSQSDHDGSSHRGLLSSGTNTSNVLGDIRHESLNLFREMAEGDQEASSENLSEVQFETQPTVE